MVTPNGLSLLLLQQNQSQSRQQGQSVKFTAWEDKPFHARKISKTDYMYINARQLVIATEHMSIIQQLAEIESKALKYKEQDTLYIYTRHPRAGETVPQWELRIDGEDQTYVCAFMEFLKANGLSATVSSPTESHNRKNFTFLPREK
jgi:hypothetical protein